MRPAVRLPNQPFVSTPGSRLSFEALAGLTVTVLPGNWQAIIFRRGSFSCHMSLGWDVPAMPSLQVFYNPPLDDCGWLVNKMNVTTTSIDTTSSSIANYNLLSACAACQGAQAPR